MVQKYKINMETRVRLGKIKVDNDDATNIFQIIEIFIDKALLKIKSEIIFLEAISDKKDWFTSLVIKGDFLYSSPSHDILSVTPSIIQKIIVTTFHKRPNPCL